MASNRAGATNRRGFVARMVAVVSASGVARRLRAQDTRLRIGDSYDIEVRHVPAGFKQVAQMTDRRDGFGLGSNDKALWYVHDADPASYSHPLSVYFATNEGERKYVGGAFRTGARVTFLHSEHGPCVGDYFDGMWEVRSDDGTAVWTTRTAHTLVCVLGPVAVIIRGSRVTGVQLAELVAIAQGIRVHTASGGTAVDARSRT